MNGASGPSLAVAPPERPAVPPANALVESEFTRGPVAGNAHQRPGQLVAQLSA
jgi:hypothetical protein